MHKTYLALCFDLSRSQAVAEADWLPIFPEGQFTGVDGRSWTNNNPDGVVSQFTRKRPIDIEHSTHIKGPEGEPAPAVGWVLALENRDGEIWGQVEWNPKGQSMVDQKDYAFYSPAFKYNAQGHIISLSSIGLTNEPNMDQLPALNREESTMLLPVLITQALGLAEDASVDQAVAAITGMKSEHAVALNRAQQPDLKLFVPKETYELALNRATTAEAQIETAEHAKVEALVADAVSAGKVAPANTQMYIGLCRTAEGRDQFKAFIETAPVLADDKQVTGNAAASTDAPSADELALCRKMGIKPDEYMAAKQAKQGE